MVYYSSTARQSALKRISELQKVIATIPGDKLDYTSAQDLNSLLVDLERYIKQEDRTFKSVDK